MEETGCEKVNIIAHSKGGLDSRAAIAHWGLAPYVATLTTINTPHRGCIFAEYLLDKIPEAVRQKMADGLQRRPEAAGGREPGLPGGGDGPDRAACLPAKRNAVTPDVPGRVVRERHVLAAKRPDSGKFPLNVTYPIVKHFDGQNDGLVSVDSARWGESVHRCWSPRESGASPTETWWT